MAQEGLSTSGSAADLEARYRLFLLKFYANLDKAHPLSKKSLALSVSKEEDELRKNRANPTTNFSFRSARRPPLQTGRQPRPVAGGGSEFLNIEDDVNGKDEDIVVSVGDSFAELRMKTLARMRKAKRKFASSSEEANSQKRARLNESSATNDTYIFSHPQRPPSRDVVSYVCAFDVSPAPPARSVSNTVLGCNVPPAPEIRREPCLQPESSPPPSRPPLFDQTSAPRCIPLPDVLYPTCVSHLGIGSAKDSKYVQSFPTARTHSSQAQTGEERRLLIEQKRQDALKRLKRTYANRGLAWPSQM